MRCSSILLVVFWADFAFASAHSSEPRTPDSQAQDSTLNLDFEDGLMHWSATGNAFQLRDRSKKCLHPAEVLPKPVSLGGDYWQALCFPVGQHGQRWVSTYDPANAGDAALGTLTSAVFTIGPVDRYFSFLVSGSNDAARERIELQVRATSLQEQEEIEKALSGRENGNPVLARDGDFLGVISATGSGGETFQQRIFTLPEILGGKQARIKIVDDSTTGHIGADYFQFSPVAPPKLRIPVWGFADYHTHPVDYLAFGHLKGVETLWGSPGFRAADYEVPNNPKPISDDIPHCVKGHRGGPLAEVFIGSVEKRLKDPLQPQWRRTFSSYLAAVGLSVFPHHNSGGPEFRDFPTFLSSAHQQMHITQIHRAWQGGLRLMVAFATHNQGAEFLMSKPHDGKITPTDELDVLQAQICRIRALVDGNSDWMQIAYTPEQARDIISSGKLAIILGQEMDQSGQLLSADHPNAAMADEVQFLWDLGVRHVIPIHAVDNRLGSPAVFEDAYNTLNDLLLRSDFNISSKDPQDVPKRYFEVREGCPPGAARGECARYHLDEHPIRAVVTWLPFLGGTPFVPRVTVPEYDRKRNKLNGHMNARGLTDDGRTYIKELMQRGMLVDLAHMSERSVEDVWSLVGTQLAAQGHPECSGFGTDDAIPAACYSNAYPLVVSHAHFRALSIQDPARTTVKQFLPSEYEISDRQLRVLQLSGGFVGPFVAEETMDETSPAGFTPPPFPNDCAMSSKSFGYSYSYALQIMKGRGVGLASDFTFIPGAAPRFGKNACWIYNEATNPTKERKLNEKQYLIKAQQIRVQYRSNNNPGALVPYNMDKRSPFDFNVDGLANYGLLPDLLQDLKDLGMTEQAFTTLFSSAEDYIQTWEKAVALSGCASTNPNCQPVPKPPACGVLPNLN